MLENTGSAVVEEVVTPQPTETVEPTETVTEPSEVVESESVESEVAPDTEEKQSKEENAKFAELRRKHEKELKEAEQKARDKLISDQYGKSHNIHTEAEYKEALAKQKQNELLESLKEGDKDPMEIYKQMKENDPEFQAMRQSKQEAYVKTQLSELNNDLKGLELDVTVESLDDLAKLSNSDDIIKYVEKGNTLSEAYFLANKSEILNKKISKVQSETLEKVASLENANPGALKADGDEKKQSIFSLSKSDFKKMQEDVLMGRYR